MKKQKKVYKNIKPWKYLKMFFLESSLLRISATEVSSRGSGQEGLLPLIIPFRIILLFLLFFVEPFFNEVFYGFLQNFFLNTRFRMGEAWFSEHMVRVFPEKLCLKIRTILDIF